MRKTPSYLKGLAETRARVAGDVERFTKIRDEVTRMLENAQCELSACDRLIQKYDPRLNPTLVKPIHAWQGRYGKRGALQETVKQIIQDAWPNEITTAEIGWSVQLQYQLCFPTWQEKKQWQNNSVRGAIKILVEQGLVERLHELTEVPTGEVGRWRWKSDASLSVDHLLEQAAAAGVSIQEADDDPE